MDFSEPEKSAPPPPHVAAPPTYGGQHSVAEGTPVPAAPPGNYQFVDKGQAPPPEVQVRGGVPGHWSTGLCGCFSDVPNCCITLWCPCITFGQIAEIADRGSTSCGASGALYASIAFITGAACLYSCFYRTKMRKQYMLPESPCADCLVHCCCELCALCQEYRELKHRGFDMSAGWHGNVGQQNQGVTMAPFVQGGMTR